MPLRVLARLFVLSLIYILALAPAQAQTLPAYDDTMINDWDNILDASQAAEMRAKIKVLREDTGIEMVVVTMASRAPYDWAALEPFATALFNDWGVGDGARNDGIMILLLREDREMRIELGAGYSAGYNRVAQSLVDTDFLPHFRADNYAAGLIAGTDAAIAEIARPKAKGEPAPSSNTSEKTNAITFTILMLLMPLMMLVGLFWKRISTRLRRCPTCGQRTLHLKRETTIPATYKVKGTKVHKTNCSNCDYTFRRSYSYSKSSSSSSSGGSFGGGSSSGGGASGRW